MSFSSSTNIQFTLLLQLKAFKSGEIVIIGIEVVQQIELFKDSYRYGRNTPTLIFEIWNQ
jgi:hypothetical protein